MSTLNFETGIVTFSVNDTAEVSFNPTDSNFVETLFNTFDGLDEKQDAYKEEVAKTGDKRAIFETARRMDKEMREMIDAIFQTPVADAIFGRMNVYALADGLPVWCNFLLAVMDQIDTTFAREQKATNPRIKKYTEKYRK